MPEPVPLSDDELQQRAQLHRVVAAAAALHTRLAALPDAPRSRIGVTAADLDRISWLASGALWRSTADLHQVGRDVDAVIARAAETDAEVQQ
jgi:hypothetical protein